MVLDKEELKRQKELEEQLKNKEINSLILEKLEAINNFEKNVFEK